MTPRPSILDRFVGRFVDRVWFPIVLIGLAFLLGCVFALEVVLGVKL